MSGPGQKGAALGDEDLARRLGIKRVGGQTIDGLGGQGHDLARPQQLGRAREIGGLVGEEWREPGQRLSVRDLRRPEQGGESPKPR